MNMAGLKAAIAHPSVKILDCSLNISHKYIRSYYARMFEAKFITGIIAGSLADDDNVGYIADNPVYGACANINAFALGVKSLLIQEPRFTLNGTVLRIMIQRKILLRRI